MARILVGLNYHRIGDVDPESPYHRLHTVARPVFEAAIAHARALGPFVSLDDVAAGRLAAGVSFLLTFDDVSATVDDVRPWLEAHGIPFHLCPATAIARDGRGVRDKVNWIIARLDAASIAAATRAAFGPAAEKAMTEAGFYRFTKGPRPPPEEMERRLIEPLFARARAVDARRLEDRAYLSWDDIRAFAGRRRIGIVNHSAAHRPLEALSEAELAADVAAAEAAFAAELGSVPADYAVPFGAFDAGLAARLERVLGPGYRSVLWVDRHANLVPEGGLGGRPLHLGRLHAPTSLAALAAKVDRAIRGAHRLRPEEPAPRLAEN